MVDTKSRQQRKTAVVVGALGVIGRYIVDRLAALPDWEVVGLSRRKGADRELLYASADVVLNVSHSEGGANAVLEAMVRGACLLASSIPGNTVFLTPTATAPEAGRGPARVTGWGTGLESEGTPRSHCRRGGVPET